MKIALLLWSWSGEEIRRRPDLIFFASKNSSVASQFERPSPFVRSVSSYIRFSVLLASSLIILSSFLRSRKGEVRFNRASRRNGEQRNRTESKGSGKRKRDGTRNGNRERLDETKETGRKERERREKAKGGKGKTRKETGRTRTPSTSSTFDPKGKGWRRVQLRCSGIPSRYRRCFLRREYGSILRWSLRTQGISLAASLLHTLRSNVEEGEREGQRFRRRR